MNVRKIVAGLAAVSMLAAFSAQAVFAADTVTIQADEVTAAQGKDFTLDISLADVPAQGISAMEFAVTYDASAVTITGVKAGAVTDNGVDAAEKFDGVTVFEVGTATEGLVTITYSTGLSDAQYCITDSGVFATLEGTVKADAADGTYPVKITAIPRETVEGGGTSNADVKAGYIGADGTVTKYATTLTAGAVVVGTPDDTPENPDDKPGEVTLYGDANCDGEVDIMDVIAVNKFLLGSGKLTDTGKLNADVDQTKTVDTTDSLNIIKLVVEIWTQADMPIK
jgi:hypothetical protein